MFKKLFKKNIRLIAIFRESSTSTSDGPLKGIKVLDLTRVIAGPTCTLDLADYGAEVYKIENPNKGDDTRNWSPFIQNTSCFFIALNRNKKSVSVNFKLVDGQEILKNLAGKCDILVENYMPGVLKKYNLDYESLKLLFPRLIYCSVTGFGSKGPYAHKGGYDLIAASLSGNLHLTGPEDGEPCRAGTSTIDIMTGLRGESAIMAALYQRTQTGLGCKIDVNLLSSAIAALNSYAVSSLNLGIESKRMGTEHGSVVPYKVFKTKDGYFTIGAVTEAQFKPFCEILNIPELCKDERFCTIIKRAENRKKLYAIVEPLFLKKTTKEWQRIFENTPLAHGVLNTVKQVK